MLKSDVTEYIRQSEDIELQVDSLREAKKHLDENFKDKLDLKSVKDAIRIAKIHKNSKNPDSLDEALAHLNLA